MNFSELEVGLQVKDRWFPSWGIGKITILLKTRVVVKYLHDTVTYDKGHVQFLTRGIY